MPALPVPAGTAIFPAGSAAMTVPPMQNPVRSSADLHRQRGFPGTGIPEQRLMHPVSDVFRLMAESPAFFHQEITGPDAHVSEPPQEPFQKNYSVTRALFGS